MPRKPSRVKKASRVARAESQTVCFAEAEFDAPLIPMLVIRLGGDISLLVGDKSGAGLAAEFVVALRDHEQGGGA